MQNTLVRKGRDLQVKPGPLSSRFRMLTSRTLQGSPNPLPGAVYFLPATPTPQTVLSPLPTK